ncbi:YcxB family protein [Shewanella sp. UCD-KL12]|uniref:YcxB family protein n=1 Tax=Shewanella sp. UCD-KL12 TaxID=1917163 RepID=UPI000971213A|nr:YcxB family protein [Shewanella sp. UCD-KL12]
MKEPFSYTTNYILDKQHFNECFDESVTLDFSVKAYAKAIGFFLIGVALLLTYTNAYASWFLVGLGVLEAFHVKFKKTWWLWRQMMSKAAGNEVSLTVNEEGVITHSLYVDSKINWHDTNEITVTKQGFLIKHSGGTSYLSKRPLNSEAIDFIIEKSGS